MAVSLNTALGAYPITALAGTSYVPLAGGTMTGALTIASGTLTASAPALAITQTWNEGATVFTAASVNVTNSASAGGSFLQTWSVGGSPQASIQKTGLITSNAGLYLNAASAYINFNSAAYIYLDAAAQLALRNGTTAQRMHIYGTYTDSSNYERLSLSTTAGSSVNITAETLGTGGDNLDIVLTPAGTGSVKIPVAGLALSGANANFLLGTTGTSRLTFAGTLSVINKNASADLYFGESTDTGAYFFRGTGGVNITGAFQVTEMTAPSAPSTNSVRIYAVDNGAGKTQLMALFASGAAQQIAIEP